jgi:glycerophosphoryl diester phosphodiesterase
MKLIAHRGNINGPNKELENTEEYIISAIKQGFYAEIDVWLYNDLLYLGHDKLENITSLKFLQEYSEKLYIHCKNINALNYLIKFKELNLFFHNTDDATLTRNGEIWTYPSKQLFENSICVMPEWNIHNLEEIKEKLKELYKYDIIGICSDYLSILFS